MTESDAIVVHVGNTLDDGAIYYRTVSNSGEGLRPHRWMLNLAGIFLFLSVGGVLVWLADRLVAVALVAALMIGLLPLLLLQYVSAFQMLPRLFDPKGLFLRPHDVTVSSQGVSFKSDMADLKYGWRAFLRVEETPTHFFLFTDKVMAYVVPKRSFESTQEADRFGAMLHANIKAAEQSA